MHVCMYASLYLYIILCPISALQTHGYHKTTTMFMENNKDWEQFTKLVPHLLYIELTETARIKETHTSF